MNNEVVSFTGSKFYGPPRHFQILTKASSPAVASGATTVPLTGAALLHHERRQSLEPKPPLAIPTQLPHSTEAEDRAL